MARSGLDLNTGGDGGYLSDYQDIFRSPDFGFDFEGDGMPRERAQQVPQGPLSSLFSDQHIHTASAEQSSEKGLWPSGTCMKSCMSLPLPSSCIQVPNPMHTMDHCFPSPGGKPLNYSSQFAPTFGMAGEEAWEGVYYPRGIPLQLHHPRIDMVSRSVDLSSSAFLAEDNHIKEEPGLLWDNSAHGNDLEGAWQPGMSHGHASHTAPSQSALDIKALEATPGKGFNIAGARDQVHPRLQRSHVITTDSFVSLHQNNFPMELDIKPHDKQASKLNLMPVPQPSWVIPSAEEERIANLELLDAMEPAAITKHHASVANRQNLGDDSANEKAALQSPSICGKPRTRRRVHPVSKFVGEHVCWNPDNNDCSSGDELLGSSGNRNSKSRRPVRAGRRTRRRSSRICGRRGRRTKWEGVDGNRRRKPHNPWTLMETRALIRGVETCGGGKWADIKRLGLQEIVARTPVDLKDKWRNLLRVALLSPEEIRLKKIDRRQDLPSDLLWHVRELAGGSRAAQSVSSKAGDRINS